MTRRPLAVTLAATLLTTVLAVPALAQSPDPSIPAPVSSPGTEVPPSPEPDFSFPPEPEFNGAPELEARFPAEVGGVPLDIESFNGADLEIQFAEDDEGRAQLLEILEPQGKTIADLSVATAAAAADTGFVAILAVQVAGADMASMFDGFAQLVIGWDEVERTELEIAGKPVIRLVPSGSGPSIEPIHAVVTGDTLWFVQSEEPLLTEAIGLLP